MIKIGTRDSKLAVWQASLVQDKLLELGIASELVFIKSEGDLDTVTPVYAFGIQGVFTRTLDAALLGGKIDIAVHSLKDVPTEPAQGILQAAVLERGSWEDVLVPREDAGFLDDPGYKAIIATSSIRRRAQWLHRYPAHWLEEIRGNVDSRLLKLRHSNWDGAIFAAAGLERIGLLPDNAVRLDWMLPAPAQGAIVVFCRQNDPIVYKQCHALHHPPTGICVEMERRFLQGLMGGCSAPISALATFHADHIYFIGQVMEADGGNAMEIEESIPFEEAAVAGHKLARLLLERGAGKLIGSKKLRGNE